MVITMKYTDTKIKNKAHTIKFTSITLAVFFLIFTFAVPGILLNAEPETAVSETEGDTTESNPPMTGETQIVYERAPRTVRIIDIASISNPNGHYVEEETEYTEETVPPETEAVTQKDTAESAAAAETSEKADEETNREDFEFNSKAAFAIGTVFIIIILFTALVIFIRRKHPSLIIEKNDEDNKEITELNVADTAPGNCPDEGGKPESDKASGLNDSPSENESETNPEKADGGYEKKD